MWTITNIRRHISDLGNRDLFVSRDFLPYGTRSAIDIALWRMVNSGEITRLARGVFMKTTRFMKLPPEIEVARVKAQAFCKEIFTHPKDVAKDLGLIEKGNDQPTYLTTGRTTSFRCGDSTITLVGSVPRKVIINDSNVGKTISALWHMRANESMVQKLLQNLGRFQRQELLKANTWMVGWLSNLCHLSRCRPQCNAIIK
jgi:hypothetical protein